MGTTEKKKIVLLVSSSGGHWVQMSKLLPALEGCNLEIATVDLSATEAIEAHCRYKLRDFNKREPINALVALFNVIKIILRSKATHVISTGAAPGMFALMLAKFMGKRTLWLDSIANVQKVSLSGRLVHPFADVMLTQWEPLAGSLPKLRYCGRIL